MPRRRRVSSRAVLSTVAQLIDSAKPERPIGRRLLIFESNSIQAPCFHNLPHSFAKSQKSPLCFHILTNTFSCISFRLIFMRKMPGVTRRFANSNSFNKFVSEAPILGRQGASRQKALTRYGQSNLTLPTGVHTECETGVQR